MYLFKKSQAQSDAKSKASYNRTVKKTGRWRGKPAEEYQKYTKRKVRIGEIRFSLQFSI